jgi:hypothetical protein
MKRFISIGFFAEFLLLGVFGGLALIAVANGTALADPIPIVNSSFEDDYPPSGGDTPWVDNGDGFFNTSISGWTIIREGRWPSGTWVPIIPGPYFNSVPDGTNIAFVIGGSISQTLSTKLVANKVYTLTVHVGDRPDFPSAYAVQLYAGDHLLAQGNSATPISQWLPETVTYKSTSSSNGLGSPLIIKLVGGKVDWTGDDPNRVNFDKVTLDESPYVMSTGFLPPFDKPVSLKKKDSRAIPVKMVLKDLDGNIMTDVDIPAPVINVTFGGMPANIDPGYNDDLVPGGLADIGNAFRYDPTEQVWIINLATKQFTSAGEYTVTAKVGAYTIEGCIGTFTRLP